MPLPFHLNLRSDGCVVSLIRTDQNARVELGIAYPQEDNRRERVPAGFGIDDRSPRTAELATINIPLSPRTQTILSYRLPPEIRRQVNAELSPLVHSRHELLPGVQQRIRIDYASFDSDIKSPFN